jgi:hypothetical protein
MRAINVATFGGEPSAQGNKSTKVLESGFKNFNMRCFSLDPLDREVTDAEAVMSGQHQKLGVEKPVVILDPGD